MELHAFCRALIPVVGLLVVWLPGLLAAAPVGGRQMLNNAGFESGLEGWEALWTREKGTGTLSVDKEVRHSGNASARVRHTGARDWSFTRSDAVPVEEGEIYEFTAWVRVEGEGDASLCVILRDVDGETLDWMFAERRQGGPCAWRELKSRFIVPPGAAALVPRLVGRRAATVWIDEVSLTSHGTVGDLRAKELPDELTVSNAALEVTFRSGDLTLSVTDKRTGRTWTQAPADNALILRDVRAVPSGFDLGLVLVETGGEASATIRLEGDSPELTVELAGEGELPGRIGFPHPFLTRPGDLLIMPVNEGISYPVDDRSIGPMHYILYGGHGLCMAWYGVTDGAGGMMAIVQTPDDASVRVARMDGRLCEVPLWDPQKGRFGPPRRMRYVFFADGGYVAMAKRYRAHAQQIGLFKTLAQKRQKRPAVDMLVGAVNVWCWEREAPAICREMRSLGIERILWSNQRPADELRQLNEMGVLTSRYDTYRPVMPPGNFPHLRGVHPCWTQEAWPDDITLSADGTPTRGWGVRGKNGNWYHTIVVCNKPAVSHARQRISKDLETHPYRCRFIDTTTAAPWRECYHPDHPLTRSESRFWKMKLLGLVGEEFGLVTGSETGHDAAVPYVEYFEGMLSLGPYRVPDAGRRMQQIWHEVPERVAKFQTGHYYRLPLWELVYHECVVAQWYWGDYNNKLPSLWDRRDLFNALYATPPMFMFNRPMWDEHRDRFVQSYKATCPIARACGYSEMTDHRWLTDDHSVQQTSFSNGVRVTVNFGDAPYRMDDGHVLTPMTRRVEGMPEL